MIAPTALVLRGAADAARLARRLPGVRVCAADGLPDSECAEVVVLVLRSGVRLGAAELKGLPALRLVVRPGSGVDHIDVDALARHGIRLTTNPGVASPAVAEWTTTALAALARRMPLGAAGLRRGRVLKAACLGVGVRDLHVGIWGAGPIGRAVGAELTGHGVTSIHFCAWPSNPPQIPGLDFVDLARSADAHVLALPLRPATREIFGVDFVAAVRHRQPLIVCVGRLGTVDAPALLGALDAGDIGGLAIDPIDDVDQLPGAAYDDTPRNLLLTPHIAAQRADVRALSDEWVAEQIAAELVADVRPDPPR